jgi:preprotein translocase subunit SecA
MPILKHINLTRGGTVERIGIPFTDGQRQIGAAVPLKTAIDTEGKELIKEMEKIVSLAMIDLTWKEHLRDMDDLRQSVRNAAYEQKDPLLIYKFEGFEMFKTFIGKVNQETISFLLKAEIPISDDQDVQEARAQRAAKNYQESKEESRSALSGGGAPQANRPPIEKPQPVKSTKIAGRNERVNVQYQDGRVMKDVKYKNVEQDLKNNKCVLID